jgi:hypothetical protein
MRNQILIYGECNKNASAVARLCTISFNQANVKNVYVKIYQTAQTIMFYAFLNQKRNIHVNFANVLWVAFSIPSRLLSLVKYPVHICRLLN